MDRLQALCAINGMTANLRSEDGASRKNPIWLLTITPKNWRHCGGYNSANRGPRPQIEKAPPTGERVWCVESESGTIITRRRGKVTVMGNCQMIGRGLRTAPGKSELLILDHSDSHLRLGKVTDIHHDKLLSGKRERVEAIPRKKPLPIDCPQCSYLLPAGSRQCSHCGYRMPLQSSVVTEEGELVRFEAEARKIKRKTNGELTWEEKVQLFGELKGYAQERGYKDGWAANLYREKCGVWPNDPRVRYAAIRATSPGTRQWIKSRQIAYGKRNRRSTDEIIRDAELQT